MRVGAPRFPAFARRRAALLGRPLLAADSAAPARWRAVDRVSAPRTGFLAAPGLLIHCSPGATFCFPFGDAAMFVTFFYMFGLTFLLGGVGTLVAAWHIQPSHAEVHIGYCRERAIPCLNIRTLWLCRVAANAGEMMAESTFHAPVRSHLVRRRPGRLSNLQLQPAIFPAEWIGSSRSASVGGAEGMVPMRPHVAKVAAPEPMMALVKQRLPLQQRPVLVDGGKRIVVAVRIGLADHEDQL